MSDLREIIYEKMTANYFLLVRKKNTELSLHAGRQSVCPFVESKNVLHPDLKSVSVRWTRAVQLVAFFG